VAKEYTVKSSVLGDTIPFDDGDMNKFVLTLEDEDGNEISDVAHWRPAKNRQGSYPEGARIEAELKNQPRGGLKLANPKQIDGPVANGQTSGGTQETWDYRQDATGRSIERQVALKCASEIAAAAVAAGHTTFASASKVVEYAAELDAFLSPPASETVEEGSSTPDDDIPF
jgi:hypothetical protein